MSGEKMGTNDCTAERRREAKFVSINVKEYHCESTAVTSVHWGGGETCVNSFVKGCHLVNTKQKRFLLCSGQKSICFFFLFLK